MNKQGFTLVEMLLSLFIIMIMVVFVSYNVLQEVRGSQVTNAGLQVSASLDAARSCAMATSGEAFVKFNSDQIEISCNQSSRTLSNSNVEITSNFPDNTASFNQHGVVNQGATISVCNQSGCEKITIGIGRSDVRIK